MQNYENIYKELAEKSDPAYKKFQDRLIKSELEIIGVRTPYLRTVAKRLAKEYVHDPKKLFLFPKKYYEIAFLQLNALAEMKLPLSEKIKYLDNCVGLIDCWALCDSFKLREIAKNKDYFIPCIQKYLSQKTEFSQRYALVTLLSFYTDDTAYYPLILQAIELSDRGKYYVSMAAAWLLAEMLIKNYNFIFPLLQKADIDVVTWKRAAQKARDSFRLTAKEKAEITTFVCKKQFLNG